MHTHLLRGFSNACRMAKLMCVLKILVFSEQMVEWDDDFKLHLQDFGTFNSHTYIKFWI